MQIIYLTTFGMNSSLTLFLEVINDQKLNFDEKNDLSPYEIFL